MSRKSQLERFLTKKGIRSYAGYTLVEVMVILAVLGILMGLTFGAYQGTKKEQYVKHVANMTQVSIRDTFIDQLATKTVQSAGTTCDDKAPKIRALMIRMINGSSANNNPVAKLAMCEDTNGNLLEPVIVEDQDPAKGINYKQSIEVGGPSFGNNTGYFFMIFTSPYGKYYSYYTDTSGSEIQALSNLFTLGGTGVGWEKGTDQIYAPKTGVGRDSVVQSANLKIKFDSDASASTSGIVHTLTISPNGNVKLD